ncbi:MAG: cofactor-independent phosphoglycerate mutase [Pirellulales bacterium]|nr:cofactor-independent phosphoglycerate mutase [Pirellulales bacterium]
MKYFVLIPDGAADEPQESLGGKSPLEYASIPTLDRLAAQGRVGLTNHVPDSFNPGSEVACMSLLGYDPLIYFTGRAPLEAAAKGITLGPEDWAVRCNLVTIEDEGDGPMMVDFTADHITTAESTELLEAVQEGLASESPDLIGWEFVPGVSYRNLLLFHAKNGGHCELGGDLRTTAPHDRVNQHISDAFPRGTGSRLLTQIMERSETWLKDHPVNRVRKNKGFRIATHVWLWGAGQRPAFETFKSLHGVQGTMITGVDLLRGLAELAGWRCREVEGATGYLDTDYAAKGQAAIDEFSTTDLVCVHVEAPDEAGHEGNASAKVKALEEIDKKIVAPVIEHLEQKASTGEPYRVLVCPDHPTFCSTRMHSRGLVPYIIAGSGVEGVSAQSYDEKAAAVGPTVAQGSTLIGSLFDKAEA